MAVRNSNTDVGGRLLEAAEKEFMIRGLGYIESVEDIRKVALGVDPAGTPILLQDVARVSVGPDIRRGLADWNGEGEIVGGIVVVRHGADTLSVIRDVKTKIEEIVPGLPKGVEIEVAYDRSGLIERSVESLESSLTQQFMIVGLVCLVFLFHVRSGLVAIITLPVGILMAFIAIYFQGLNLNIMSLGGIAVAIGTMVDAGIVMVENAHKHLARGRWQETSLGNHRGFVQGSGPIAVLLAARNHRVFHAGIHARSAGETALQAAGVYQDLCHGSRGAAFSNVGSGPGRLLGAGPHQARGEEPHQSAAYLFLQAGPGAGASLQVRGR